MICSSPPSDVLYPKNTCSPHSGVPAEVLCRGRDFVVSGSLIGSKNSLNAQVWLLYVCVFSPDVEVHFRTFFDEKGDRSHHQSEDFSEVTALFLQMFSWWTSTVTFVTTMFLVNAFFLLPLSASTRGCERFPGASGSSSSEQRLGVPAAYWWRLC